MIQAFRIIEISKYDDGGQLTTRGQLMQGSSILVYLGYILLKRNHQMTCGTINDLFMLFNISLKASVVF